jgi:hypothetical protein
LPGEVDVLPPAVVAADDPVVAAVVCLVCKNAYHYKQNSLRLWCREDLLDIHL